MSDIQTQLSALLAKKGQDYFAEVSALLGGMVDQLLDTQAMLFAAVSGTSTTSISIGTGAKSLTLAGTDTKSFVAGQRVNVRNDANNYMVGNVDSWDSGTRALAFTVAANDAVGSGSHASWTISLSGDEGQPGDVSSSAILTNIAAVTPAANKFVMFAGSNSTIQLGTLTTFTLGFLDDADAATALATLTAMGQGTYEVYIPASAMWPPTTNGAEYGKTVEVAATKPTFFALAFDATTKEYAQFAIRWPKSLGTATVTFKAHWSHPSTTTNFGVVFELATLALSDDDAANTSFGTGQTVTDTGGTTSDIYISPTSSAITAGNTPAVNDMMWFQLARLVADASDTMAVDAYLHGITLYVTVGAPNDA